MKRICCDLPEEIFLEIFSWLHPKSLFRFKCVSISLYALINFLIKDTTFVNKHLRNINKFLSSTTCFVFVFPKRSLLCDNDAVKLLIEFHDDDHESDHINYVCEDFHLPALPSGMDLAFSMKSQCNGIVFLEHCKSNTIILCNPAIKESRTLPKPRLSFVRFCATTSGIWL